MGRTTGIKPYKPAIKTHITRCFTAENSGISFNGENPSPQPENTLSASAWFHQHVLNQANDGFFLSGRRLGHQQRQGSQPDVINHRLAIAH